MCELCKICSEETCELSREKCQWFTWKTYQLDSRESYLLHLGESECDVLIVKEALDAF